MSQELDERDFEILTAIAEQTTLNTDVLSDVTGIPRSTVHYRLQCLREDKIIKNGICEIDADKIGLSITVITEVWAEYDESYHETVGSELRQIEGVSQVYFLMGDTDFIVISRLTSREAVKELIKEYEAIDEIKRTSSKYVITTIKDNVNISCLRDYNEDTLFGAHGLDNENSSG